MSQVDYPPRIGRCATPILPIEGYRTVAATARHLGIDIGFIEFLVELKQLDVEELDGKRIIRTQALRAFKNKWALE